MTDIEEGFRRGFGQIDTMPSPLPPLNGAELAARASAVQQSRRPVPRATRLLVAAAAVLLVIGTPVAIWLARGTSPGPIPAEPATTPSARQLVVPPLTRTPSRYEVLVDDPLLIDHETAGEGGVPSGFFVGGDTITVIDGSGEQLVVYHGGSVVDRLVLPSFSFRQVVVWDDTYYLLGETLGAFTRRGDALVVAAVPEQVAGVPIGELYVEGDNLVAETLSGQRLLVAGPGPVLPDSSQREIVADGFTILDGAVDAHLQVGWDPSGIYPLGRDSGHVWYQIYESRQIDSGPLRGELRVQGFVYEFATDGRLTATYTLDPTAERQQVSVANGRVYVMAMLLDPAVPAEDTIQVRELEPNPEDAASATVDPAEDCELVEIGVDPIACTQPEVAEQPIAPLPADPDFYVLSTADGKIRCDIDGRHNRAECVTSYDLEPVDPGDCPGTFDQNYAHLSYSDGTWLSGQSGCHGRLKAQSQQPPVLPVGAVLTTGQLAVFADADGITVWNPDAGVGFAIRGERVHSWGG